MILLVTGCARKEPLPILGSVPRFELTAQDGHTFDSGTLTGKIWVADFFFTSCNGPCPRMSAQMRQIQNKLAGSADVRFVSITVDPARDTPQVLAAYAKRQGAREGFWHFLTGDQDKLHDLCRNQFKLGNVDGTLEHSTRFVLLDRKGRIRAYYRSFDDDMVEQVVSDARRLVGEDS